MSTQVEALAVVRARAARTCRAAGRRRRSCPGRRRSPGRSRPAPASAARRARRAPAGSRSGPRSWRSPAAGTCARARGRSARPAPGSCLVDLAEHLALAHVGAHRGEAVQDAADRRRRRRRSAGSRGTRAGSAGGRSRRRRRRGRPRSRRSPASRRPARAAARTRPSAACGTPGAAAARRPSASRGRRSASAAPRRSSRRGMPSRARGGAAPPGSSGSRNTSRCAASRSRSSGTEAAACDAVGVVEHEAEVADAPDAGLRADRRLADLDPRVAERALLGLAGAVVEVDLLVRAARDAVAPAAALVLVDEDDAVLLALVHRARRADRDARRVQAVLADPRQEEHERLLVGQAHLLLHGPQVRVLGRGLLAAGQALVPVGPPLDVHRLAGELRVRPRDRVEVARAARRRASRSRR